MTTKYQSENGSVSLTANADHKFPIYFCLECKRLNVVVNGIKRPGGSDYVVHGMARFVSGQYASAVRHGGMLGYVLDGNIPGAIANVESIRTASRAMALLVRSASWAPNNAARFPAISSAREGLPRRFG